MSSKKNQEESFVSSHSKKKILVWQLISAVLFMALIIAILLAISNKSMTGNIVLAKENVNSKVVNDSIFFIKTEFNIEDITIKETKVVDGLYEITVLINKQEMQIYTTPSGENLIIPGLGLLNKKEYLEQKKTSTTAQTQTQAEIPKTDKPKVEVFVMSHCPYGTQMKKGLIPVIETLGDKADIEIKFVDYAMQGKIEIDEQLNQYCINKEEPKKFIPYLQCFLEAGKGTECLVTANIDSTKLNSCISETNEEFKITELLNDKSTWSGGRFPQFNVHKTENDLYGIQGSPTTVINGVKVDSMPRNSAGILSIICSSFTTQPNECQTKLDSTQPSPGFGYGTSAQATNASCS